MQLSVIEEEKLGIERNVDTPSHLVPLLYFDFVREQDPALLRVYLNITSKMYYR